MATEMYAHTSTATPLEWIPTCSLAKLILNQCQIDLQNFKTFEGETPIMMSFRMIQTESFIISLIKAGCDIHTPNINGETPLHIAIEGCLDSVAAALIEAGADINAQDAERQTPLHCAVGARFVDQALLLLRCGANSSITCAKGRTPLMMSLRKHHPKSFILSLIEAGCDVSTSDALEITPLHFAVSKGLTEIVEVLIKKGANVNAQDASGETPLHYAVEAKSLDQVCLLLYYGANVNITCGFNMNPFMYGLRHFSGNEIMDILTTLFNYYDDFSVTDIFGSTSLLLALLGRNPIAIDLVKSGADVHCVRVSSDDVYTSLEYSLNYGDAELFKMIWSRLDCRLLLNSEKPFLLSYLEKCQFPVHEWLECFYVLLTSAVAFNLVDESIKYIHFYTKTNRKGFFRRLIDSLCENNIPSEDRLAIIYLCLSLGAEVNFYDISYMYQVYGFTEELAALLYNFSNRRAISIEDRYNFPFSTCLLAMESYCNAKMVFQLPKKRLKYDRCSQLYCDAHNDVLNCLNFFSINFNTKLDFTVWWDYNSFKMWDKLAEVLDRIPAFPSLLEISRNQVRNLIKEKYKIKKSYQFYDIVNGFKISQKLKDIILFKISPYEENTMCYKRFRNLISVWKTYNKKM